MGAYKAVPNAVWEAMKSNDDFIKNFKIWINTNIRQGKLIELDISDKLSEVEKNDLITSACKKLLVNEIIEEYEVLG